MRSEQRFQAILTMVGGFLMPLGLAVIGIGWWGTAHTGYVFEQLPYLVSGGLFGLGLTFCGALIFFSAWLARLVQLQREQAELTRRLLDQPPPNGLRSTTEWLPMVDPQPKASEPQPKALEPQPKASEPQPKVFDRGSAPVPVPESSEAPAT